MIISEQRTLLEMLEKQIKSWDESGISLSIAPWHCGMGNPDNKSRYQKISEEIKYLKELLNDNQ